MDTKKPEHQAALRLAYEQAWKVSNPRDRFFALAEIAYAQGKLGFLPEAKDSFELAQQAAMTMDARKPNNRTHCANTLVRLASQQAEVGDSDGARKSFNLAKGADNSDVSLANIAIEQTKALYFVDAVNTVQSIKEESKRSDTLGIIAKIMANVVEQNQEE